jgi:S-adenosyl methyltransferase
VAGGLSLVAVVVSVFVMVRFGRRLRIELSGLYDSARQMAGELLPQLVDRLRRGEDVDVRAESPPLQAVTPDAQVAYVDNDPVVVVVHLRAVLASGEQHVTVVDHDVRDVDAVLDEVSNGIDLQAPTCLILGSLLHSSLSASARTW